MTVDWLLLDDEPLVTESDVIVMDLLTDAQHNADLDGWIGQQVASGTRRPTIRLWRSAFMEGMSVSRRDVSGPNGHQAIEQVKARGWDFVIRQTGGTAVPQGPGVLHMSWLLPRTSRKVTTDAYFRLLCAPLLAWLRALGIDHAKVGELPNSYCDGKYNILVGQQKLIGTAQAWRGSLAGLRGLHPGYVLAHAVITVDVAFDQALPRLNTFYCLTGDSYRVQSDTAVDLRTLVLRGNPAQRGWRGDGIAVAPSAAEANRAAMASLYAFLCAWLPQHGVSV